MIEGRNAVIEALRAGVAIDKIFLMKGETDSALGHIASAAREKGVVVVDADRRKLDGMSRTHSHQGVIALAAVREYATVDDILNAARDKGEPPLIVVCDELSDPHNLGAVIRTSAPGPRVIILMRRSKRNRRGGQDLRRGGLPPPVAGGQPALPAQAAQEEAWIFGSAADGTTSLYAADLKAPPPWSSAQRDGHEPAGLETCDFLVTFPCGEAQFPQRQRGRRHPAV
ncbi:MAG: TrmH family RNA methyltransferase [Evtepia gabavorous]